MNVQDIKPSFCLTQLCLKGKPELLEALLKHLRAVVRAYEPGEIILCAGDRRRINLALLSQHPR